MTGVVARSSGARRLFIDPSVIQKLVPYWTEDEAKACAKMIYGIVRMRVINGSDPSYEANDFVSCAYEGVIQAKKRYEQEGEKLKVEQCRGYLRSYTAEEVKKKGRSTKLDVMDSGAKNLVYDDKEAMEAEATSEDADSQERQTATLAYIRNATPHLFEFACDFFEYDGNKKVLVEKYKRDYHTSKRQLLNALSMFQKKSQ